MDRKWVSRRQEVAFSPLYSSCPTTLQVRSLPYQHNVDFAPGLAAVEAAGEASGGGHGAILPMTCLLYRDKHKGVLDNTQVCVLISPLSQNSREGDGWGGKGTVRS